MTIPEAALLVIQAGAMAKGGEVFVLDMGEPVKIAHLAQRMVQLSGLSVKNEDNPEGDIEITFTGLRPGEKLYEELLIGDNVEATGHPKISKALEAKHCWPEYNTYITAIKQALSAYQYVEAKQLIRESVSGFSSTADLVDWMTAYSSTEGKIVTVDFEGKTYTS